MSPASRRRCAAVFPIRDFAGTAELDFVHYELEDPKYDTDECRQRGMTYAAPMRVTLRLIVFEVDPDTETRSVLDIKEQDVYMGDMPLMTKNGTFIVNGTERVIVSQMHRSPGVLFDHDRGKTHASGKYLFAARVIPYRGSWLDFEFDAKDIVNVRIDRKRKLPVTALLHALGLSSEEILNTFYDRVTYRARQGRLADPLRRRAMARPEAEPSTSSTARPARSSSRPARRSARAPPTRRPRTGSTDAADPDRGDFRPLFSAYDLVNDKTGEIYIEAGDEVSPENLEKLDKAGIDRIELLDIDHVNTGAWIRNTLKADKAEDRDQALSDIYRVMRPGEPPTRETAEALFAGLFFDPERYDLSAVGRVKLNMRLDLDAEDTVTTLRKEDIVAVVKTLVDLKDGKGEIDDIDNLGNRRVRSVGELLENQYRVGLLRMERAVKERMSLGRRLDRDAERPDQRQARGRRGARVLRLLAALAVHGPDQPALRSDAQAPRLGARAGRPHPRARGLRGPRRPPDPLWPDLPDRDSGRPEYRPDQLASPRSAGSTNTASSRRRTARSSTTR